MVTSRTLGSLPKLAALCICHNSYAQNSTNAANDTVRNSVTTGKRHQPASTAVWPRLPTRPAAPPNAAAEAPAPPDTRASAALMGDLMAPPACVSQTSDESNNLSQIILQNHQTMHTHSNITMAMIQHKRNRVVEACCAMWRVGHVS